MSGYQPLHRCEPFSSRDCTRMIVRNTSPCESPSRLISPLENTTPSYLVDCVWNVMAHPQKPDFVFRWNGRVHLNRRGRQFSRLLAAEVCASAVVMLDTPCSEVRWRVLATHSSFAFTSPPVCHRVPSHFNWTLFVLVHRPVPWGHQISCPLATSCEGWTTWSTVTNRR